MQRTCRTSNRRRNFLRRSSASLARRRCPQAEAAVASDVEAEVHDIAFADDVLLAFETQLAGFLRALLTLVANEVVIGDDFCANESFFEIRVDDPCRLRRGG